MTYNVTGKRIRSENLAGQVTTTAWDYLDCIPVGELNSAVKEAGVAEYAYEYAPFGALTVSRGASAEANPFRFSSEYAEDDTATVYYNYRQYEPVMGRWSGRDRCLQTPLNHYLLLANRMSGVDCLGKYDEWVHYYLMYLLMRRYGLDERRAKALAEGSQYPDGESYWASFFRNEFDAMYVPYLITFRTKYQETLHNLNGLESERLEEYQCCIRNTIGEIIGGSRLGETDYFKIGVLLHALGDTYAHFKVVSGANGKSYYQFIGHAEDGTAPDNPHHNMVRFREYLQDVENLIRRLPSNPNYDVAKDVYDYMRYPSVTWFDPKTGESYKHGKMDTYKDLIRKLYSIDRLPFEKMSVLRTSVRNENVKALVEKLEKCLRKARAGK